MILNCGSVLVQWRPRWRIKCVCSTDSPSLTAEKLRHQLDSLHKEANTIRIKASSARSRLIRLSEAVEKLRRQAAVSVQTGKENEARDLLFQKKKVMQALENLKNRIELFDQLSLKLNEAISMKECLLVGNMALDLEVNEAEAPSPVRIISPTEESTTDDYLLMGADNMEFEEHQEMQVSAERQRNTDAENDCNSLNDSFCVKMSSDADNAQNLRENSTYEDLTRQLDEKLNKIQQELETFIRVSNLLLESKERPEYSKVQHVTEILLDVYRIRKRIATIKQAEGASDEVLF